MKKLTILLLTAIGCSTASEQIQFDKESFINEVKTLASDEFQGRRPFTLGETKSIEYIAECFKKIGLEPGNGDSWFQNVPLVEITPVVPPQLTVSSSGKKDLPLKTYDDYIIWTENTEENTVVNPSNTVFAGFGVTAPEYNWDDYAGLEVKDKIVIVMVNDPGFTIHDTTLFKGKRMTYYGRWTYKYEEAARHGAKGCLIIHQTEGAAYPFSVVQNSNSGTRLYIDYRPEIPTRCTLMGWLSAEAGLKLLKANGLDSSVYVAANKRGFKAIPLASKISARLQNKSVFNNSKNVAGLLKGTEKPDEYVVVTAHWDHFGISKPDASGDSIYNGALDNASGVATILELARAFKKEKIQPKRSILFLSVTGEEQGLLGSAYYAHFPIFPLKKTVGNVNFDGINNYGRTHDVVITGKGQNELEDIFEKYAKEQKRYATEESKPQNGSYYRSDHFNFALAGVPAIDAGGGIDVVDKGKQYGQEKMDYYTKNLYHTPKDEYTDGWNLDGTAEDWEVSYKLIKELADSNIWPRWKEGSEFKAAREKQ